jgi:hypothetical protein
MAELSLASVANPSKRRGDINVLKKIPPAVRLEMLSRKEGDCLIYKGVILQGNARNGGRGYGQISIGGKRWMAHRLAWTVANGPIPIGLQVLHRCDVRACVNPKHLFLGTQDDNMKDMSAKGRSVRGEKNRKAKITAEQARTIRSDPRPHRIIGADYGLSHSTVGDIKRRNHWRHII